MAGYIDRSSGSDPAVRVQIFPVKQLALPRVVKQTNHGNQLLQDNLDGFMFIRKRHAPAPAQQEPSPKRNTLVPQPTHSDDRLLSTGQSGALHTSMQHSPRLQPQPQPEAAAPLCEQQPPPDLASVVQQCLPEGCPMHIRLQLMVAQLLSRHAAHPQAPVPHSGPAVSTAGLPEAGSGYGTADPAPQLGPAQPPSQQGMHPSLPEPSTAAGSHAQPPHVTVELGAVPDAQQAAQVAARTSQLFSDALAARLTAARQLLMQPPGVARAAAFSALPPLLRAAAGGPGAHRLMLERLAALKEEEALWTAALPPPGPEQQPSATVEGAGASSAGATAGGAEAGIASIPGPVEGSVSTPQPGAGGPKEACMGGQQGEGQRLPAAPAQPSRLSEAAELAVAQVEAQAEFVAGVVAKAQLLLQRAQQSAAALHDAFQADKFRHFLHINSPNVLIKRITAAPRAATGLAAVTPHPSPQPVRG